MSFVCRCIAKIDLSNNLPICIEQSRNITFSENKTEIISSSVKIEKSGKDLILFYKFVGKEINNGAKIASTTP